MPPPLQTSGIRKRKRKKWSAIRKNQEVRSPDSTGKRIRASLCLSARETALWRKEFPAVEVDGVSQLQEWQRRQTLKL